MTTQVNTTNPMEAAEAIADALSNSQTRVVDCGTLCVRRMDDMASTWFNVVSISPNGNSQVSTHQELNDAMARAIRLAREYPGASYEVRAMHEDRAFRITP